MGIKKLDEWLADVKKFIIAKAIELEEKWPAVQEGIERNLKNLRKAWREAAQGAKTAIEDKMKRLHQKFKEVRAALEKALREGIKEVRRTAIAEYKRLRPLVKKAAQKIRDHLMAMKEKAISKIPTQEELQLATELISEQVAQKVEKKKS